MTDLSPRALLRARYLYAPLARGPPSSSRRASCMRTKKAPACRGSKLRRLIAFHYHMIAIGLIQTSYP